MYEQLNRNVAGKFWKGPDVQLIEDRYLVSGGVSNVPILIKPENLPPLYGLPREAIGLLEASVRSRYAQAGIDVHEGVAGQISQTPSLRDVFDPSGNLTDPFEARALIYNQSERTVKLESGARLFRFFYPYAARPITGEKLVSKLKDGEIEIGGDWGYDWMFAHASNRHRYPETVSGIYVRVDDKKRYSFKKPDVWKQNPASETLLSSEPLIISDTAKNYRQVIDRELDDLRVSSVPTLWIGEGPHMSIRPGLESLIAKGVMHTPDEPFYSDKWGIHINSRLIDGGSSWGVRYEIISSTLPNEIANYVYHTFWEQTKEVVQ